MAQTIIVAFVLVAVILLTTWLHSSIDNFDTASPFICRPSGNQFVAVRKNADGDVDCMATDAKNCMWTGSMDACNNTLGTKNPQPLTCGKNHKAAYGVSGYDTILHWCNTLMGRINKFEPEEN